MSATQLAAWLGALAAGTLLALAAAALVYRGRSDRDGILRARYGVTALLVGLLGLVVVGVGAHVSGPSTTDPRDGGCPAGTYDRYGGSGSPYCIPDGQAGP